MRAEADEAEKERFRKERVFRWMNDGIRPMNRREQVIVVESPPFDRHYREFQLSIIANRDIKLAEGVGFLIGNDGPGGVLRPHFRQLTMSFAPNGDNPPTVTLSSPNPGEKLLLMFKAESLSPDPAAVLPSSPDSFGISLRSR